jgi:DNA polymerase delta subunit 4
MTAKQGKKITDSFAHGRDTNLKQSSKSDTVLPRAHFGLSSSKKKEEFSAILEDGDETERMLRDFDMSTKYGPVSGLSRLERYNRAKNLGLEPPELVQLAIKKYGESSEFNKHVFSPGKI